MNINFNDFLVVAAMIAVISLIAVAFLLYQSDKQLKEYKKRTGQK
jgi:uncharacterized membrane protein